MTHYYQRKYFREVLSEIQRFIYKRRQGNRNYPILGHLTRYFHLCRLLRPRCYILSNTDVSELVLSSGFGEPSSRAFSQDPSSGPTPTQPLLLVGGGPAGADTRSMFFQGAGSPAPPASATSSLLTLMGCLRGTLVSAE